MSNDVHIITGMDAIINQDNVRSGIDLKDLERRMISGGIIQQRTRDPTDKFNDELKDAAKRLGINFDDSIKSTTTKNAKLPMLSIDGPTTRLSRSSPQPWSPPPRSSPPPPRSSPPQTRSSPPPRSSPPRDYVSDSDSDHGDYHGDDDDDGHDDDHYDDHDDVPVSPVTFARVDETQSKSSWGGDLQMRTMEQERRAHIESVMGRDANNVTFSLEKEKREDTKSSMLAEIDSLLSSLNDENVDLTRVPKVGQNSSYEEVEAVLRMLRHKQDHTRYCTFAEEFMLFGAYALEELFDGKRMWFGRYQPDLTGWHNHVNVKLRRMRHDTGQIVSGVMQEYNIGSGARVLLELLPSMVLYSKMKKSQFNSPDLFQDADMAAANTRLSNN